VAPGAAAHRAGEQQTFTATGVYSDAVTSRLDVGNGDWTIGAGMPTSKYNLAAASSGGRLYAFGGLDVTAPSNAAAVYDPALDAWSPLPAMPTAREGLAAAAVSGAVYAIGGNTAGNVPLGAVERFDPTTGNWSGRAPMPTARRYLSTAVVNGIIYAIGGEIDDGVQATSVGTVEAYDPASNTWTARAPMPTPRRFFAAAAVNGRIYAAGGDDGRSTFTLIEEYDPASNSWQQLTVWIPELLIRPAGAAIGGVLYVAGLVNNGTRVAAYQYDVYNQVWTEKSDVPTTRRGPAVVSTGNTLYVAGGRTQEGVPVNTLEAFVEPLTWSSSDLRVAAVATSACNPAIGSPVCLGAGTATALALGTATITATAGTVTCGSSCGTMSVTPAQIAIELPANGASVGPGFQLSGWALNLDATSGTGVDAVHVYAAPNGGNAIFLGVAAYGAPRPDIAALFGNQFLNSGFTLGPTAPLAPGGYTVTAYAHNAVTGQFDATASVAVTVSAPASRPAMAIDAPAPSQQVASALEVSGWTLDLGAASGTGVDAVHVYVFPNNGAGAPMFAGQATYGLARPDVGAIFGAPFTNCGYHLTVSGLSPGAYLLAVIAHSTVTSSFSIVQTVHFTVTTTAVMTIDTPADLSGTASAVLTVAGWSIDRSASGGTGVDALHVYAFPNPGSGQAPIFLGVAAMGMARPDVGALYGAQFTNAGYGLTVTRASAGLAPGFYAIVVASHSTTTGTFNNVAIARVTLQ
jgi:N-acetylneuraminic acid mutarotase